MANFCPEKNGPALYPDCIECRREGKPFCEKFFLLVVGSRTLTDIIFTEHQKKDGNFQ